MKDESKTPKFFLQLICIAAAMMFLAERELPLAAEGLLHAAVWFSLLSIKQ
ncbi:hypothetical protein [Prevotella sp. kh1p2]|uniref:hypothetical protein n=1 Tax=Prevotella sp. kh1p2 TaxID=1761883 RepID=UPI0015A62876|nr:hypothetical protein [Prevotella sp. kh1p2]